MKIAVVGGGITGLTAILLQALKFTGSKIDLYTMEIGGEFDHGGLKYFHYPSAVEGLLEGLGVDYKVVPIIGLIYYKNEYYKYPFLITGHKDGKNIHKMYWNKTRGNKKFDKTCMNNPYNQHAYDLGLVCNYKCLMNKLIDLANKITNKVYLGKLESEDLKKISKNYDLVINTIYPFGYTDISFPESVCRTLEIIKVKFTNEFVYKRIFWDYVYFPEKEYDFHRISVDKNDPFMYLEFNGRIVKDFESQLYDIMLGMKKGDAEFYNEKRIIKGHLTLDKIAKDKVKKSMPENVKNFGRYACLESRMTYDIVYQKLMEYFRV